MTKDELVFIIDTKQSLEFSYNGKNYSLTYDKDGNHEYIVFGQTYQGEKFKSFGEFFNNAKIESSFLKDMLDVIKI
jgi:hypothetical protein